MRMKKRQERKKDTKEKKMCEEKRRIKAHPPQLRNQEAGLNP